MATEEVEIVIEIVGTDVCPRTAYRAVHIPGLGSCSREGTGEDGGAAQAALESHQVAECGEGRRREEAHPGHARPHKCQRQACDGVRAPGRNEVGAALAE
jgi:hypothetical protein